MGVSVGLGDGGDPQALPFGGGDVLVDAPIGIDDHGGAGGPAADQIGGPGQGFVERGSGEHGDLRIQRPTNRTSAPITRTNTPKAWRSSVCDTNRTSRVPPATPIKAMAVKRAIAGQSSTTLPW